MKLSIGDRVSYHPENSFPPSIHDGHTYTGTVTYVRAIPADLSGFQYDRANVDIDPNPYHLIEIECNQAFLEKLN